MVPEIAEQNLYCYDSMNMPPEWVAIKNPFNEDIPGVNVEVYKTSKPAVTNHLKITLEGYLIESVMIVPIKRNDVTLAMLELIHSEGNKAFTAADLHKALVFAEQLSVTLSV